VHPTARLLARHPGATGNGDAPVERHRRLVRHERTVQGLPHAPRLVLPARSKIVEDLDLESRRADPLDAAAVDDRVGVAGTYDDPRDPRADDGVCAGRRAPVVRARLERDVEDRAVRRLSCRFERDHFGVADSVVLVPALPHDLTVADDEGADQGMVAGLTASALGELERALEVAHERSCARPR
jgi:hypothetical protein